MKIVPKPIFIGSLALSHIDFKSIVRNYQDSDIEIINKSIINRMTRSKDRDLLFLNQPSYESFVEQYPFYFENYEIVSESITDKFKVKHIVYKRNSEDFIEVSIALTEDCTTALLFDYLDDMYEAEVGYYPNVDMLYTLKMSHRYLKNSPHFYKTMVDIRFMRKLGAEIFDQEWYVDRIKETYDYQHPKLNVASKDFFTSNVNYVYNHDSIHLAMAHLDKPAYQYYMSGNAEVHCSKETFLSQPRAICMFGVLEEVYVLALERSQIPNNFKVDPKVSFMIALEKVCTSITSGWFREYAWENYEIIKHLYDETYVDKFKAGLESGIIQPFEK